MNSSYIDDHYYDTSDGFKNYEPNTSDPGPWMTIGVCLYSIMCVLVFLPLSVVVGKMCTKRITRSSNDVSILNKKKTNTNNSSISSLFVVKTKTSGDDDCPSCDGIEIHSGYLMQQSRQHEKKNSKKTLDKTIDLEEQVNSLKVSTVKILDDLISKSRNIMKSQIFCKKLSDQRIVEENETAVHFDSSRQLQDVSLTTINKAEDKSVSEIIIPMAVVEETSMVSGSSDEQHSKEKSIKAFVPALKTTYNRNNCYALSKIISCDKETVRILKLGGPFTISSLSDSVFDAIILAIVSKYLGVQSLSAMVVTHLLVGLTDTFIKGVADTLETLCSHAIGTDNYTLAGQYAQIAVGIYTIVSLPVAAAWWFLMDDAIRLFGMNEAVVIIGHDYSKVLVGECLVTGIYHALFTLLDISGYASHTSLLLILEGTISVLTIWGLLHSIEDMNLFWVGVTKLCICSLVYLMFAIFVIYKGWLNPFWHGMTKTFAFKNIQAVKNVVGTAMPLALGTLLDYGEWEALTFFAAALGPAEVVAWGILESIWDLFEAATEGLAEAGSMRLALHLGRGDIPTSKLSSWKTLFLSTVLACTLSSILFILSPYIPRWFTDDTTLIKMVEDQLPLIGFGNIFMVFGMTSWSLIGAQGRYKIATVISATMTLFVTLPLAALFCIGLRYSLISLVGAVVVGYSTTGLCLGYLLQMSDWEHISKNICDLNDTFDMDSSSSEEVDSNSDDDDDGDVFVDNA